MRSPANTTNTDGVSRNTSEAQVGGDFALEPLNPLQEGIHRAFNRWSGQYAYSLQRGCVQILKTCGEQTQKWTDADFKAKISAAVDSSSNGEQILTVGARKDFIKKKRAENNGGTHYIRCLNLGGEESMYCLDELEFDGRTPPENDAGQEYFPRTWEERMTDWLFSQDAKSWNELANKIYGERTARSSYLGRR
ncbi:hypothetical protein I302_103075 [Kwoniella bestiolae CBS 10118]|uniref:Uncharacterized protein n=1 Tax=Kwoniella bestiolae CBS 10118 TaxID=1296100 RepID=A0A1B9GGX4_9TREE|nr:hypothetical protein I302_01774 [Kwoniella bestiolae CBS 10118]OCF30255.1 hypothetical protein I302_01774 [Kwoniella bestiolae CBS 10118]